MRPNALSVPMWPSVAASLRHKERSTILGLLSLVGSGMLAALCFSLLASQRVSAVSSDLVVYTVLFVQWQTLGLTVVKLGIEQVVFAAVSADRELSFDSRPFIVRTAAPLLLAFALVLGLVFSPLASVIICVSILADVSSLILQAELNAHRQYQLSSVANLLNYPVFFLLFFTLVFLGGANRTTVLLAFATSSAIRWAWLFTVSRSRRGKKKVVVQQRFLMGLQQSFNYVMFKSDQLLVAALLYLGTTVVSADAAERLVFLAKFPELISGVAVIVGTVAYPRIPLQVPDGTAEARRKQVQESVAVIAAGALLLVIPFIAYRFVWGGSGWTWGLALPYFLHGALVFTANRITFSLLQQGLLIDLIRNLVISVTAGAAMFLGVSLYRSDAAIAWMVPAQLVAFLACFYALPFGARRVPWAAS